MSAVSVILPTHDRPRLLPRAVASVLDQSHRELELIVVDDASREPAAGVLGPAHDPRLRLVRSEAALGPARARNLGLAIASGPWVAFQDDDDEWLPGKLERQWTAAAAAPDDVAVVYGPFERRLADGRIVPGARPVGRRDGDLQAELLRGNFVGLPTALVRRSALDVVGTFDPELRCLEDWELFLRLAARFRFVHVEGTLVLAHDTPASVNKASLVAQTGALERILERHRDVIERDAATHADFLFHLAHCRCLAGDMRAGRRLHGESFRRHATPRVAAARAAAWLGPGVYAALARLRERMSGRVSG